MSLSECSRRRLPHPGRRSCLFFDNYLDTISPNTLGRYAAGPAEFLHDGKATGLRDLQVVFDSGSTYTYFTDDAYGTALDKIKADLMGKLLEVITEDKFFPICWKGAKPFRSLTEVKDYFKPLALSFPTSNTQLQLPPRDFLIIDQHDNVCLGIRNGSEKGLGELNVIGGISMQDTLVIYDNEKKQIGRASIDCNWLPKAGPVLKVNFTDDARPVLS